MAWDDLLGGEPCISLTANGIFVGTRYKRALCKGLSGLPKTVREVEAREAHALLPSNLLLSPPKSSY